MQIRIKLTLAILFLVSFLDSNVAGQTTRPPQPPIGEATLAVKEQFFNSFLEAIFNHLKPPSTPLIITSSDRDRTDESSKACPSVITLKRESNGIKTTVKLEQGRITAPLAFSGSYNSTLMGCLRFSGLAHTEWSLEFDKAAQVLQARIRITDIQLENLPALTQGSITKLVQAAIDSRINPLKILRPDQLSGVVAIAPAGGSLRLRAREVRPEISPGNLQLHITYELLPEK